MATTTKRKKPFTTVYMSMPDDLYFKLKKIADKDSRTIAFVMREAAEWWLKLGAQKKTA